MGKLTPVGNLLIKYMICILNSILQSFLELNSWVSWPVSSWVSWTVSSWVFLKSILLGFPEQYPPGCPSGCLLGHLPWYLERIYHSSSSSSWTWMMIQQFRHSSSDLIFSSFSKSLSFLYSSTFLLIKSLFNHFTSYFLPFLFREQSLPQTLSQSHN